MPEQDAARRAAEEIAIQLWRERASVERATEIIATTLAEARREEREMSTTTVPGLKAKHAIITPVCRTNRSVDGAFDEAIARLRAEYLACQTEGNVAASFHLVLTLCLSRYPDETVDILTHGDAATLFATREQARRAAKRSIICTITRSGGSADDPAGRAGRGGVMGPCVCGHSPEEHPKGGACEGTVEYRGKEEPCRCVAYEEDVDA